MRKLTFLTSALLLFGIVFMQCSKKSSNPSPTTSSVATNTLTISGQSTESLTVSQSGNFITGQPTTSPSTNNTITVDFTQGAPTSGTVTLGTTQPVIQITSPISGSYWLASSGTATVTVSGSTTTVTFINATFTAYGGGSNFTATGSVTSPGAPSGTLSVGGSSQSISMVIQNGSGQYSMIGDNNTSLGYSVSVDFNSGKPGSTGSATLSTSNQQPQIFITDGSGNSWIASSGTINYTISGSAITASFTNATFTAEYGNSSGPSTLTATASLYSPN